MEQQRDIRLDGGSGDGSAESRQQVAEAVARAGRDGKQVAVIFVASWCPDAQALQAALEHRSVSPFVDPAFVVVKVDVGQRDRNLQLMADYGMAVDRGIPAVAVLDAEGQLQAAQNAGEFRTARSMPLAVIADHFHRWSQLNSIS